MLPGVHRVRAKLSGNRRGEYWYAWRGGPCILKATASSDETLAREVSRLAPAAAQAYGAALKPRGADNFLSGLIVRYLESGEYARLSSRTKDDLRRALDVARRDDIGILPLKALEASKARHVLISWRDRYKKTPKTADVRLEAVAKVLTWAHNRGEIGTNPLEKWPRLYKSNRADVIWADTDVASLLEHCEADFARAVRFAAATGLRLGDLARITRAAIGEKALVWQTGKSRGRRTVIIPIRDELKALLEEMPAVDVGTILTHSRGKPWTVWGLQTAMQRAKAAAGIKGLRFHDLRGTGATHLVKAGIPLEDVATIMGWARSRVEGIAMRYVTSEAIAEGMIVRLEANKKRRRL